MAGFSAHPSVWQPRHCAGSGLARKYKDGLEAHFGDGVATRIKGGTHLQQLDSTEDTQKPSSEIRFGNWVCAFVWPTQPFVWPPCVFIIYYRLIIKLFPCYGLICAHFTFILPTLHISPFSAFGPWQ